MVYASSISPETVMSTRMGILLLGQNNELWIKGSWLLLVQGNLWLMVNGSWFMVNGREE